LSVNSHDSSTNCHKCALSYSAVRNSTGKKLRDAANRDREVRTIIPIICEYIPNEANENELKWIEMDSDFQKYWFANVKINVFQFWIHFYSFIRIAWSIFLCLSI